MRKVELMKEIAKVDDECYRLIAWIAITIYDEKEYLKNKEEYIKNQEFWITFSDLKILMNEYGLGYSEGGNRGLASDVGRAEEEYRKTNEYIRHAIAVSFRNKDGNLAFNPDN